MILIRVDGNRHIATGHLMRTLTIAKECVRRNVPVHFVVADEESERILKSLCGLGESFKITVLQSDYRCPEEELPVLTEMLKQERPEALLLDSYFVTAHYLEILGKYTKVFYLDDIRSFDYPVDTVINYDVIMPEDLPLYQNAYMKSQRQLLGAAYTPLREQFRETPYAVKEKVRDILITTGGTDEDNLTGKILESVLAVRDETITVHIVIGALNRHRERLKEAIREQKGICLHEGVQNMAELMNRCDLAISAAGTTLYELCAVGVPTICFTMAANQIPGAESFARSQAVVYERGQDFGQQIKKLTDSPDLRRQQSEIMRRLVDGKGTARIVDELLKG